MTPQLVIVAGPNGSGKSTLTESGELADHGLTFPERYINADNIACRLADAGWTGSQQEQGVSFAFETVPPASRAASGSANRFTVSQRLLAE